MKNDLINSVHFLGSNIILGAVGKKLPSRD
jgi:hypothetical protein